MSSVVAVARDVTALKLRLTGVSVREVSSSRDAEEALGALLDGDSGVVIVEEALRHGFSDYFNHQLARHRGLPLVVYCPAFETEESDADAYINSVLKPAVGFEIRLED